MGKPKPNKPNKKPKAQEEAWKKKKLEKEEAIKKKKAEIELIKKQSKVKRLERNKMISKRTKKGQPVMKDRIEYLLKKIQTMKNVK